MIEHRCNQYWSVTVFIQKSKVSKQSLIIDILLISRVWGTVLCSITFGLAQVYMLLSFTESAYSGFTAHCGFLTDCIRSCSNSEPHFPSEEHQTPSGPFLPVLLSLDHPFHSLDIHFSHLLNLSSTCGFYPGQFACKCPLLQTDIHPLRRFKICITSPRSQPACIGAVRSIRAGCCEAIYSGLLAHLIYLNLSALHGEEQRPSDDITGSKIEYVKFLFLFH